VDIHKSQVTSHDVEEKQKERKKDGAKESERHAVEASKAAQ